MGVKIRVAGNTVAAAGSELVTDTTVTADGLFTVNYGVKTFAMQFVKPQEAKWRRANQFVKDWAAAHGLEAKDKKARSWFRNDETIVEIIGEQGKLGLKDKGIEP